MHLTPLIHDLAIILAVAGIVTLLFQRIRQPLVLGYIVAGFIVGPYMAPLRLVTVTDLPNIRIWGELGVIFLMFSLGLEFSFRKLAKLGPAPILTAAFEVSMTFVAGMLLGRFLLGWKPVDCVFLGAMLCISSTTIIYRALDELRLKTRRFAELIFAVLIVEDLLAVVLLVALSAAAGSVHGASGLSSGLAILSAAGHLVLFVGGWFVVGYFVVPRTIRYVGNIGTEETLTIVSLALCLSLAVVASYFQYSTALGAFIMGSILAESTESSRIEEQIVPVRNFFVAVFFVSVGMLIDPAIIWKNLASILAASSVLIAAKVVFTMLGALLTGQTLRTSVQVGFGIAQIGEFSFIIAALGNTLKVTSDFVYPVGVAVSLITTFTTPYMIRASYTVALALERRLPASIQSLIWSYSIWAQSRRADVAKRKEFYTLLFRWLLNGLVVSVLFTGARGLVLPYLERLMPESWTPRLLCWLGAVAVSSPFIWAMFSMFRRFKFAEAKSSLGPGPQGGTLLMVQAVSLVWIGLMSLQLFPPRYVLLLTLVSITVLLFSFRKRLEASYHWFEKHFASTFQASQKTRARQDLLRHLAPWDAHLVRIKVHPNADIVGKRLMDAQLRSKYGLNIVVIQRGLKSTIAPRPEEMIMPEDELLVLGTDEQVDRIRGKLEQPPGVEEKSDPLSRYELREVKLAPLSPLVGKTIRASRIREDFGSTVVGLERTNRRMINPDSDLELRAGDCLWVVGETEGVDRLAAHLIGSKQGLQ